MADIATVFHWPLHDLAAMDLADLIAWRERARVRAEPAED
ncbi:GpE family phage tail protein [Thauera phenylacetica]